MRTDAHQHFWQVGRFDYPWMPEPPSPLCRDYLPRDLYPVLERNRFEGSIAVQATHDLRETEWLLELAGEYPWIAGVVGWVDLTDARMGETLDRLQTNPRFKGVRHMVQDEPDHEWLLRGDVIRGLRELARRGLPYDLLIYPRHLPLVPRLAEEIPDLRMVIDHIAKPPIATGRVDGWAEGMERAAQYPLVFAKLSGMITETDHTEWKAADLKPFVAHAYRCFGADRLMFGSDWPVCLLAGSWKAVLAAFTQSLGALPMETREQLLGGTAARFYGISS
jgi:L-fuconolactonase